VQHTQSRTHRPHHAQVPPDALPPLPESPAAPAAPSASSSAAASAAAPAASTSSSSPAPAPAGKAAGGGGRGPGGGGKQQPAGARPLKFDPLRQISKLQQGGTDISGDGHAANCDPHTLPTSEG
jgi:hypothetical protein